MLHGGDVWKREGKLSDCYISFIYDLAQLFIYLFIWCVSLLLEVLFFKKFKKWQEMKAIIWFWFLVCLVDESYVCLDANISLVLVTQQVCVCVCTCVYFGQYAIA